MTKIRILLVLMILLSLFCGISINARLQLIYQYEFIDYPQMMKHNSAFNIASWIGILLSHSVVIVLPFIAGQPQFRKVLFWAPFLFLLFFLLNMWFFAVLLTPFTVLWIITMVVYNRMANKTSQKDQRELCG